MSKIKNPTEKKRLSLQRDRRNVFGENSKSSRKNIAKAKQRRNMDERRAVAQLLSGLNRRVDENVASQTETKVRLVVTDSKNRGFSKMPDKPLGDVIQRKLERRRKKGMLGDKANATV